MGAEAAGKKLEASSEPAEMVVAPPPMEKPDDFKSLIPVQKYGDESAGTSTNRDAALVRLETDKKMSIIRAWEENEKAKAENKAEKKMAAILAWENTKKAALEAELKKTQEKLEKKKAEHAEKLKNKIAMIHKEAEEKRAMVQAKRGENMLKAEEGAARYRATGQAPKKKILVCFGA